MLLRAQTVEIACPARMNVQDSIHCHALLAREESVPESVEALERLLLTSEVVTTREDALDILWFYSRRWWVEDFHKAWEPGTRVEELRPRSADNLERGVVILAFVAIQLLRLQELVYPPTPRHGQPQCDLDEQPCDTILTATEWCVLYMSIDKTAPLAPPLSAEWAYRAIGKPGGWMNTQRTGRPG
jgi:hypothetical protein